MSDNENPRNEMASLREQAEVFERNKQYKEAIEIYDKMLDLDPGWAYGYKLEAELHELMGNSEEAAKCWQEFRINEVTIGH
jgi:tetratricopeptide (TPR) repeat protein